MLKVEYIIYTYLHWNMDISSKLLLRQGMLIFIFSIANCTVESRERILCVFCPHSCTFIVVGRRHCFPFDWRIPEARCECCSMAAAGPGVQEPGDICTPGSSRGQVGQLAPGLTSSCETVVTLNTRRHRGKGASAGYWSVYSVQRCRHVSNVWLYYVLKMEHNTWKRCLLMAFHASCKEFTSTSNRIYYKVTF